MRFVQAVRLDNNSVMGCRFPSLSLHYVSSGYILIHYANIDVQEVLQPGWVSSLTLRTWYDSGRLTWLSTEGPTTGVFHATRFSQRETSKPCVVCLPIPSRNTTGHGPRDISRYVRSRAGILSGPLPNRTSWRLPALRLSFPVPRTT